MTVFARILSLPVQAYRMFISPFTRPSCRFSPTCSEYALEALTRHGAARGGWLAVRRLFRCHPWGGHGFDPVPDFRETFARSEGTVRARLANGEK